MLSLPLPKTLLPLACAFTALLTSLTIAPEARAQPARADLAQTARLVFDDVNDFRRASGAGKTAPDPRLTAAARDFANFMARTDRYGHEADGKRPAERAQEQGYDFCMLAENIAFAYSSEGFGTRELAERVVRGWQDSPGHRKNMLDANVTDTGVAVAQSAKSRRYYAVQMFGRPKDRQIEFHVTNNSTLKLRYDLDGKSFDLPPRVTQTHQRCHDTRLSMRLPGQPQATVVHPSNADRYSVEGDAGRYRLKKR